MKHYLLIAVLSIPNSVLALEPPVKIADNESQVSHCDGGVEIGIEEKDRYGSKSTDKEMLHSLLLGAWRDGYDTVVITGYFPGARKRYTAKEFDCDRVEVQVVRNDVYVEDCEFVGEISRTRDHFPRAFLEKKPYLMSEENLISGLRKEARAAFVDTILLISVDERGAFGKGYRCGGLYSD